jgi:hypothetical protein
VTGRIGKHVLLLHLHLRIEQACLGNPLGQGFDQHNVGRQQGEGSPSVAIAMGRRGQSEPFGHFALDPQKAVVR